MRYSVETFGLTKNFIPAQGFLNFPLHGLGKEKLISAVEDVEIKIRYGELLALMGPNGAGKTTLIKMLACLVLPSRGNAEVCGYDVLHQENKVKSSIGLVSADERSFYWRLSVRQNLSFFAALYNLSRSQTYTAIKRLAHFLDITSFLERRFQECPAGIKQRLAIARALVNDPSVLFIDEPTKSLDPATADSLRNFIRDRLVKEQNKTVVFVTHNLQEAEDFADRIAVMRNGRIKACGTILELRQAADYPQASLGELYTMITGNNSDAAT